MKKTWIGRILRAHSGGDLDILTPTNIILWNCKLVGKEETKALKSVQTDVPSTENYGEYRRSIGSKHTPRNCWADAPSLLYFGTFGESGKALRYQSPLHLEQALHFALAVQEAEKQERFNESFYTRFENSVRLVSRSSLCTASRCQDEIWPHFAQLLVAWNA